jgi:hypothetical protein
MEGRLSPADYLTGRVVAAPYGVSLLLKSPWPQQLYRMESLRAPRQLETADILDESNTLYLRTARRFRATAPHFIRLHIHSFIHSFSVNLLQDMETVISIIKQGGRAVA